MLGKTNANLIKNESNKVNLFDPDLVTLKRCEILNANKNTLVLKGTSADGYHADYSIDGSVNKMKILSFSCKMQSPSRTAGISIEADDGNILYSFNESDNEGLVSLNIPIEYDYMEIRFYCHSNFSSIQESTFTDIYIGIEDKDVLLTGTALAEQVLEGRTFYSIDANNKILGTMPNNNAVSKSFTPTTSSQSYTIPEGYHDGNGKVTVSAISTQTKTVTPSKTVQTVTPDSGKYLSKVTVNAIVGGGKTISIVRENSNHDQFDLIFDMPVKNKWHLSFSALSQRGSFYVYGWKNNTWNLLYSIATPNNYDSMGLTVEQNGIYDNIKVTIVRDEIYSNSCKYVLTLAAI